MFGLKSDKTMVWLKRYTRRCFSNRTAVVIFLIVFVIATYLLHSHSLKGGHHVNDKEHGHHHRLRSSKGRQQVPGYQKVAGKTMVHRPHHTLDSNKMDALARRLNKTSGRTGRSRESKMELIKGLVGINPLKNLHLNINGTLENHRHGNDSMKQHKIDGMGYGKHHSGKVEGVQAIEHKPRKHHKISPNEGRQEMDFIKDGHKVASGKEKHRLGSKKDKQLLLSPDKHDQAPIPDVHMLSDLKEKERRSSKRDRQQPMPYDKDNPGPAPHPMEPNPRKHRRRKQSDAQEMDFIKDGQKVASGKEKHRLGFKKDKQLLSPDKYGQAPIPDVHMLADLKEKERRSSERDRQQPMPYDKDNRGPAPYPMEPNPGKHRRRKRSDAQKIIRQADNI